MPTELKWDDAELIGIALAEKYPLLNPREVQLNDLHRYVTQLPAFVDDRKASHEAKLEAIQTAWHEEWMDRR